LKLRPINFKEAKAFIDSHHRHHRSPSGWKFGIGLEDDDGKLVGVATADRPIARHQDDGKTLEVTRLCTLGTPNACSMLYSACARAAKALGYERIITYILESESGTSLKASGWVLTGKTKGSPWSNNTRKRKDDHPLCDKWRFEKELA
jgi:hypothetical protein